MQVCTRLQSKQAFATKYAGIDTPHARSLACPREPAHPSGAVLGTCSAPPGNVGFIICSCRLWDLYFVTSVNSWASASENTRPGQSNTTYAHLSLQNPKPLINPYSLIVTRTTYFAFESTATQPPGLPPVAYRARLHQTLSWPGSGPSARPPCKSSHLELGSFGLKVHCSGQRVYDKVHV